MVSGSPSVDELAWTLVDLARRACALPLVSASSEVMTRALAWYLRLNGKHPIVRRGVLRHRFATLHWIEVEGSIVDVSGAETPLVADEARSANL